MKVVMSVHTYRLGYPTHPQSSTPQIRIYPHKGVILPLIQIDAENGETHPRTGAESCIGEGRFA